MTFPLVRSQSDLSGRLLPAVAALERGERDGALALLELPDLTEDERADLRARLAESYEIAGRFEEALALLRPYEDITRFSHLSAEIVARVWLALASIYRWQHEIPRAIAFANHSLKVAVTDASRGRAHRL